MRTLLFLMILGVAGCATTTQNISPVSTKAILVGENDAWGKSLIPLQTQSNTRFESLDQKKVSDFWSSTDKLEVEPGKHTVVVSCHMQRGPLQLKGERAFEQTLEAGKIYSFKATIGQDGCDIKLQIR